MNFEQLAELDLKHHHKLTWKSHSVKGISLIMYIIISVDSVLWLIYGGVLDLTPLIVQSSITFTCAFMMIIMKLLWNNRKIRDN